MPFSWSEIYKSFWSWKGYKPIECDNCGKKHKITATGRLIFVALTVLPMLIFIKFISFFPPFNNFLVALGLALAILFVGSLVTPYFVRFKVV
ncbi:TIGR04104 family putative zinc finger protein [Lentibacillus daqui]